MSDYILPSFITLLSERDCSVQVSKRSMFIGDGNESIEIEYTEVYLKIRKAMDEAARLLGWLRENQEL